MAAQIRVVQTLEPWCQLDKVVMVTGASSGLGWDFCLGLANSGCRIIAAARRKDRLKMLWNQINDNFSFRRPDQPRAVAVELDISASESAIATQVQRAWHVFGKIDALINNAGVRGRFHAPLDLSEVEWSEIIRTNQTGTWLVSKHMCKQMRDAKQGGCIINISSATAVNRVQFHGGDAYTASKAAMNTFTQVMAMELGKYNIRVNSICPGIFESEITHDLLKKEWAKKVGSRIIPLGSCGTTEAALMSLILYLIHDSSQYVTGNNFIIDGGVTLPGVPIFSSL